MRKTLGKPDNFLTLCYVGNVEFRIKIEIAYLINEA